jgi:hypothetical protein
MTVKTIELVDWPHQSVPAALHRAGFDVVGHEPDSLKRYDVVEADEGDGDFLPLEGGGFLRSRDIDALPSPVDVVCTHRPPEEQVGIARDAIASGARIFWVEPPAATSVEAKRLGEDAGLTFVDGVSIADDIARLR